MSLQNLYKGEKVKKNPGKVVLSYDVVDPVHQQLMDESKQKAEEVVTFAVQKAKIILKEAEDKAADITRRSRMDADRALKSSQSEFKEREDAFQKEVREQIESFEKHREDAEKELQEKRAELDRDIARRTELVEKQAHDKTYAEAKALAEKDAAEECERAVARIQAVLDEAVKLRVSILADIEDQITELVLLIATKVVKSLAEAQKDVVVKNVVDALKNLKGREHFLVRVNPKDLKIVESRLPNMRSLLEAKGTITCVEDSSVDPGGCIIETEFGEVDARIATQLQKIEQSIREAVPIRHGS